MSNNDERKNCTVTTVSIKHSVHIYGWHTMETETGIVYSNVHSICVNIYGAYKMYTRVRDDYIRE